MYVKVPIEEYNELRKNVSTAIKSLSGDDKRILDDSDYIIKEKMVDERISKLEEHSKLELIILNMPYSAYLIH